MLEFPFKLFFSTSTSVVSSDKKNDYKTLKNRFHLGMSVCLDLYATKLIIRELRFWVRMRVMYSG